MKASRTIFIFMALLRLGQCLQAFEINKKEEKSEHCIVNIHALAKGQTLPSLQAYVHLGSQLPCEIDCRKPKCCGYFGRCNKMVLKLGRNWACDGTACCPASEAGWIQAIQQKKENNQKKGKNRFRNFETRF